MLQNQFLTAPNDYISLKQIYCLKCILKSVYFILLKFVEKVSHVLSVLKRHMHKGTQETFGDIGYVYYVDRGDRNMRVYIRLNSPICID